MGLISTAIMHTPWKPERVAALEDMKIALRGYPGPRTLISQQKPEDMSWAEFKTHLALRQWEWSLAQKPQVTHHLFLTDDLNIAPSFWNIIHAMIAAKPNAIIGLLSNHPEGPRLSAEGQRWYRCNSWVVGPAYLVPRGHLEGFLAWYKNLPDTEEPRGRRWFNDDSALNEWNSLHGPHESWHPLPTIIEHRNDVESTVGHGDKYSRERVSWRETRDCQECEEGLRWIREPCAFDLGEMQGDAYWAFDGPMLNVGG